MNEQHASEEESEGEYYTEDEEEPCVPAFYGWPPSPMVPFDFNAMIAQMQYNTVQVQGHMNMLCHQLYAKDAQLAEKDNVIAELRAELASTQRLLQLPDRARGILYGPEAKTTYAAICDWCRRGENTVVSSTGEWERIFCDHCCTLLSKTTSCARDDCEKHTYVNSLGEAARFCHDCAEKRCISQNCELPKEVGLHCRGCACVHRVTTRRRKNKKK